MNIKLELILLEFANRILEIKNTNANPTLGEVIDKPRDEIIALFKTEES